MNNDNEKILIGCLGGSAITIFTMLMCTIPNGPRIVKHHSSGAETESGGATSLVVRTPVRRSLGFFEVTAYCPCELCCGEYADGVTASGHVIRPGDKFVAADPTIPFGMELDVPGYGVVPVLDRGEAITGRKLDVFFPTHVEALVWGRRKLEIRCWVKEGD